MKKYFCMLLLFCCMMPHIQKASAQSNLKATLAACDTIIRKYSNYKEVMGQYLDNICKKNKNNPAIFTGLAKSYYSYHTKDSTESYKYIKKALSVNSKYVPAYVAGGAIQDSLSKWYNDEDAKKAALNWYQRAIDANPKDILGYEAYARLLKKTDPDAAAAKIMSINNYVPDFQAAIYVAKMYVEMDSIKKAMTYFNQADVNKMAPEELFAFVKAAHLNGLKEKAQEVALYGHQKYPDNLKLLRQSFYYTEELGKHKQAQDLANEYFKAAKDTDIIEDDYLYYGSIFNGLGQHEKSIELLEKYVSLTKNKKAIISTIKIISGEYETMEKYDKAVDTYQRIIDINLADKELKGKEFYALVDIYLRQAETQNGNDKLMTLTKAAEKYHSMAMIPEYAHYKTDFLYQSLQIAQEHLDPNTDKGIVKGKAEELVAVINSMPMDDFNKQILPIAYHYLCYIAYAVDHDTALARNYARKYLSYSKPDNLTKVVLKMK